MIKLAATYGIAVATADYRMYPNAKYPDFIEDSADAVGFVKEYNQKHHMFSEYYVGGSSAGAYLTMMLFFDRSYLSKRGMAVEEISGYIFDAGQPTTHFKVLEERGQDPRCVRIDEAAPLYYINREYEHKARQPRIMILYSDHDIPNRLEQNQMLYRTMAVFNYDMDKVVMKCFEGFEHCAYYGALQEDDSYMLMKLFADFICKE